MKNVRSLNHIQRLASSKSILPTKVSGTPFYSQIRRLTSTQSSPSITLFQYSICPFCNINKALLSYSNTPYTIKEVNPLTKAEIKFSTDYKKVPIAIIEEEQINGSKNINSALLEIPLVRNNLEKKWIEKSLDFNDMDMSKFTSSNATKWNDFANEELAPILYPNICNTLRESRNAFEYVNDVKEFSKMQKIMIQGIGSIAMYFAASKIKCELF
jgi:microsomal prostaglandin-E synthase 2